MYGATPPVQTSSYSEWRFVLTKLDSIELTIHVTKTGIVLESKIIEMVGSLEDAEKRIDQLKDIFSSHLLKCAPWTRFEDDLVQPAKTDKIAITWYNVEIGKGIREDDDIRNRWKYLNGLL
jgi:hypothetical protein